MDSDNNNKRLDDLESQLVSLDQKLSQLVELVQKIYESMSMNK